MVKAIFFDIDGTLISFKTHKIPQSTMRALEEVHKKGIKLFICTGRPPTDIKFLTDELHDLFDGYITLNGQYCYDADNNIIHEQWLDKNDLQILTDYLKDKDIACGFIELDYFYFNLHNQYLADLDRTLGSTAPERIIDDMQRIHEHKTYQLNLFLSEDEEQPVLDMLPNCRAVRWCHLFSDIIPKEGGKSTGIKAILDYYNIDIADCMAFGDGGNDKEMLEFASIGVAMGNADDDVKAVADYVTDDVDSSGILNALKHFNLL
ncbi:MAG TPA: Cof-type HAD-IIB family hydrolase [Candidatus Megamonas gallistercoris]|nr:Cof-type HAD-IIB family hydrolase [Candidatus Megamonas gallistercoris]